MKIIILFFALCFSVGASGPINIDGEYRLLVNGVKRVPLFDYRYELLSENPAERLILDCQSFIQGMEIYWSDEYGEILWDRLMLSSGECQYIAYHVFISVSEERELCLKINPEKWTIKIGDDPILCFR